MGLHIRAFQPGEVFFTPTSLYPSTILSLSLSGCLCTGVGSTGVVFRIFRDGGALFPRMFHGVLRTLGPGQRG